MTFQYNRFHSYRQCNKELQSFREKQGNLWEEEDAFVHRLYGKFSDCDIFQMYLDKGEFDYEADRELVRKLYKILVCNNEEFEAMLEEHSLYWNDDKHIIDSFVLKTIKRFEPENGADQPLLPGFTSEDDREFAVTLFHQTLTRAEEVRTLIKENARNWEFNRLAFMDVVIMQIALTEILSFPSIPLNVTFNEYLDIAKVYSTPRSSSYINGTLDHIVKKLKEGNQLLK